MVGGAHALTLVGASFRPANQRATRSSLVCWPPSRELRQEPDEVCPLRVGELPHRCPHGGCALPTHAAGKSSTVISQRNSGPASIVGIHLSPHEVKLNALLDEARRSRLIDTNGIGNV